VYVYNYIEDVSPRPPPPPLLLLLLLLPLK
jgi:hypothetical protein